MEDFGSALEKVDRTPPHLVLDFKDKSSFEAAKTKWNWVVNHHACKKDISRVPYKITKVKYDLARFIAYMDTEEVDYKRMGHDGPLVMETFLDESVTRRCELEDRDWNGTLGKRVSADKEVSIKKDFSGNIWKAGDANSGASFGCVGCGTNGQLKVKLDVQVCLLSIKSAYIEFTTVGEDEHEQEG
jgi:hypothetical protein